jgi:hypothetical protein
MLVQASAQALTSPHTTLLYAEALTALLRVLPSGIGIRTKSVRIIIFTCEFFSQNSFLNQNTGKLNQNKSKTAQIFSKFFAPALIINFSANSNATTVVSFHCDHMSRAGCSRTYGPLVRTSTYGPTYIMQCEEL